MVLTSSPARLAGAKASLPALRRGTFATSNKPEPKHQPGNTDPEIPKFSLNKLGASPRVRRFVIASIVGLTIVECAAWVKFWPKITGGGRPEPSS